MSCPVRCRSPARPFDGHSGRAPRGPGPLSGAGGGGTGSGKNYHLIEGLGGPLSAKAVPWHIYNQLATSRSTGHVALRTYFALCLWSEDHKASCTWLQLKSPLDHEIVDRRHRLSVNGASTIKSCCTFNLEVSNVNFEISLRVSIISKSVDNFRRRGIYICWF